MAEKQYISPIRLFEHLGIEYQGEINIARIKKHLNAEFSIAKDGFIEVDGHSYNKNDVMAELDQEDFTVRMYYHQKLWNHHFLLAMLENNEANLPEVRSNLDNFQKDLVFDEFFSPYFAGPFNIACRGCINDSNLSDLAEWFTLESFIQPANREEAFMATRIFLEENLKIFRNISTENYRYFRDRMQKWLALGWYKLLNILPHEFYHYKEDFVIALINVTVTLEKTYKDHCRDISNNLMMVADLRPDLQTTISNNDKVFNGVAKPVSSSSSSGNYWWLLWVVVILFRLAASGGCN